LIFIIKFYNVQPENTVKFTVFTVTPLVHGVNCTENVITAGM